MPARDGDAKNLVERWSLAATLDHPHLLKIQLAGIWTRAGSLLAYVVTEYAPENLGSVLDERALDPHEVLEMLPPIADALTFLHGRGYALGSLKPSNIFAVQDTLKLGRHSIAADDASADLRALAETVTEALTQKPVTFTTDAESDVIESLPEPFREITERCLGKNGRSRWSAAELASWLRVQKGGEVATADSVRVGPQSAITKWKPTFFVAALAVILVVVIAVSSWLRSRPSAFVPILSEARPKPVDKPTSIIPRQSQPGAQAVATVPIEPDAAVREVPGRSGQVLVQDQVIRQVLPDIPVKDLRTIHGTASVAVKVIVNQSGDVTDAVLEPGGSRYFGRLAAEAACKWRFVSSSGTLSREYRLRFEITPTLTKAVVQRTAR